MSKYDFINNPEEYAKKHKKEEASTKGYDIVELQERLKRLNEERGLIERQIYEERLQQVSYITDPISGGVAIQARQNQMIDEMRARTEQIRREYEQRMMLQREGEWARAMTEGTQALTRQEQLRLEILTIMRS